MPSEAFMRRLLQRPVGITFFNGRSTSGILCSVDRGSIFILEHMQLNNFSVNTYPLRSVRDINLFPPCNIGPGQGGPPPIQPFSAEYTSGGGGALNGQMRPRR